MYSEADSIKGNIKHLDDDATVQTQVMHQSPSPLQANREESVTQSVKSSAAVQKYERPSGLCVEGNRKASAQRKASEKAVDSLQTEQSTQPIQKSAGPEPHRKVNNTGLPDHLKSGIERLSGCSMEDVKVHYSSDKPVQLNAHAYAQGTDIHLASGQEKQLPHETWHVVQQTQGRVTPTLPMKGDTPVNDEAGLEKEADVMGNMAAQMRAGSSESTN